MQELTPAVKEAIKDSLLPFLQINSPIRNSVARALLLNQLGFTKDQFGYTESGGSKIENLIGSEFHRLKKLGKVDQEGWIWKVIPDSSNAQTQPAPIQQAAAPIQIEEDIIELEVNEDPAEFAVALDDLIKPSSKLLNCDAFRNSLIESTSCYGNYDKKECGGCLLAFWCDPFTAHLKDQRRQEREAKRQAKAAREVLLNSNPKEALLEKYADKKVALLNILANLNGEVKFLTNQSPVASDCMFDGSIKIQPKEPCVFIRNAGIISQKIYNEIKEAGY